MTQTPVDKQDHHSVIFHRGRFVVHGFPEHYKATGADDDERVVVTAIDAVVLE